MSAPIVIVGGGFGGLTTALELARQPDHPPLLLVEPAERFVFSPLLYEVLSGELPSWTVAPRYDSLLPARGIGWLQDRVTAIDPLAHTISTGSGQRLEWQRLVLACGAEDHDHGIPGVRDHALFFRTLEDAVRLRHRVDELRQNQRPLQRLAVVGAGPTGVELACKLADLLAGRAVVELLEAGSEALVGCRAFNRDRALEALARRDVRLRCATRVRRVTASGVELEWTASGQTVTESLPLDALVWTAGSRPRPLGLAVGDDTRGRLSCTATLQVESHPDVFALGDGARVPHDPELPSSAQVAMQQAQLLAANLRRSLVGDPLEPFQWNDLGEMLSLGVGEATLTGMGLTLAGPAAQTLRRLTYLTRLPGTLPLRAAADWLADRGACAARP